MGGLGFCPAAVSRQAGGRAEFLELWRFEQPVPPASPGARPGRILLGARCFFDEARPATAALRLRPTLGPLMTRCEREAFFVFPRRLGPLIFQMPFLSVQSWEPRIRDQ